MIYEVERNRVAEQALSFVEKLGREREGEIESEQKGEQKYRDVTFL